MTISVWISIIFFIIRCVITWDEITTALEGQQLFRCGYTLFGYAGEAIGAVTLIMTLYNKWLWKCKIFKWMHDVPVLAEEYIVSIRFKKSEDKEEERKTKLSIIQTFLNIHIRLGTDESVSNSVVATIKEMNGSQMLIYSYMNEPRAELQDKSPMHYGTAMLNVNDPKHITGNYFTSRCSRGSMDLKAVEKKAKVVAENKTDKIIQSNLNNNADKKNTKVVSKKKKKR